LVKSITTDLARVSMKGMLSQAMDWLKGGGPGDLIAKMAGGATTSATGALPTATASASMTTLGTSAATTSAALTTEVAPVVWTEIGGS
jgi:hypothetical protein